MYHVVVFDEKTFIRNRLRGILNSEEIRLHEAQTYSQLSGFMEDDKFSVDMLMMDINFEDPILLEKMRAFREKYPSIPMVVFTSSSSRKAFVSAMKLGAQDFILNSIDDSGLIQRIKKDIQIISSKGKSQKETEALQLDVARYLSGEIRKAQKGKYAFTMCFSSVMKKKEQKETVEISQDLLLQMQKNYWETDVLMPLGMNHFVSFFPFCDVSGRKVLESKLQNDFLKLKEGNNTLIDASLVNEFVTFPEDGLNKEDMLSHLIDKLRES